MCGPWKSAPTGAASLSRDFRPVTRPQPPSRSPTQPGHHRSGGESPTRDGDVCRLPIGLRSVREWIGATGARARCARSSWGAPWDRHPNGPRPAGRPPQPYQPSKTPGGAWARAPLQARALGPGRGRQAAGRQTGNGSLGVAFPSGMCGERVGLPSEIPRGEERRGKADLCQKRSYFAVLFSVDHKLVRSPQRGMGEQPPSNQQFAGCLPLGIAS
jgi:hypothetical protein